MSPEQWVDDARRALNGLIVGAIVGGLIGGVWVVWVEGGLLLGVFAVLALGVIGAPVGGFIAFFFFGRSGLLVLLLDKLREQAEFLHLQKLQKLQKRALIELQGKKWHQAVISLTKVINSIHSRPALISEACHWRASAYLALNQLDRAVADCNVVINDWTLFAAVPPYVADAYLHRGTAFAQMGQHDKAIADFTDAIALAPHEPTWYERRALSRRSYERRAQSRRAISDSQGAAEDERKAHDLGAHPANGNDGPDPLTATDR